MHTFTLKDKQIGRRLLKWYIDQGTERDKAEKEVIRLFKMYPSKTIFRAMNSTACTSISNLKKILLGKETFEKEKEDVSTY